MLKLFCPANLKKIQRNPFQYPNRHTPTLNEIRLAWNETILYSIIRLFCHDLQINEGEKDRLDDAQVQSVAEYIAGACRYLEIGEVMAFFVRLKGGVYPLGYGRISPACITGALNSFLKERQGIMTVLEARRSAEEAEERFLQAVKECVSHEKYRELLAANPDGARLFEEWAEKKLQNDSTFSKKVWRDKFDELILHRKP